MAGHSSRYRFNDGEGLVDTDIEGLQDFLRRFTFDEIVSHLAAPNDVPIRHSTGTAPLGSAATASFRCLKNALCARVDDTNNPTLNIKFDAGVVFQRNNSTLLSDASLVPEHHVTFVPGQSVDFAAADATQYRRDMVQARLVSVDEATVPRDFKDAVTGALSSQNLLKRSNLELELQVKQSALLATANDADDVTNEPTPDAGWFKLCSVQIPPTSTALLQRDVWDWRKGWGYQWAQVTAKDWLYQDGDWTIDATNWRLTDAGVSRQAACFPMHIGHVNFHFGAPDQFAHEDHRRLAWFRLEATGAPTGQILALNSWQLFNRADDNTHLVDLSSIIGNTTALVEDDDPGLGQNGDPPLASRIFPPIWANGLRSPAMRATGSTSSPDQYGYPAVLQAQFTSATAGGPSTIFATWLAWWGGV